MLDSMPEGLEGALAPELFEPGKVLLVGAVSSVRLSRLRSTGAEYALKLFPRSALLEAKLADHAENERAILERLSHPFVVRLLGHFKDERCLYLLLEHSPADLLAHLRRAVRFDNDAAVFYAAQVAAALDFCHNEAVALRGLRPEALRLEADGYLKVADFGDAKCLARSDSSFTVCGIAEYMAPEMVLSQGHGQSVDWWALGVLIYEMLVGYAPFQAADPAGTLERIVRGSVVYPKMLDPHAKALCKGLLAKSPSRRFGNLRQGFADIRDSPWLLDIDWELLLDKQLPAPCRPCHEALSEWPLPEPQPEASGDAAFAHW